MFRFHLFLLHLPYQPKECEGIENWLEHKNVINNLVIGGLINTVDELEAKIKDYLVSENKDQLVSDWKDDWEETALLSSKVSNTGPRR